MSLQHLKFTAKFLESEDCITDYQTAVNIFFSSLSPEKFSLSLKIEDAKTSINETNFDHLKEINITIVCEATQSNSDVINFAFYINKLWCKEAQTNVYLQWLEPDNSYISSANFITNGNLRVGEIAFGTLTGMKDFVQSYHFREIKIASRAISSVICLFDHLQKRVTLHISNTHKKDCTHSGEMGHKLAFSYDSIIRVLANINKDSTVAELFLQLEHPPSITVSCSEPEDDPEQRVRVTKAKEMEYDTNKFERTFQIGCTCNNTLYTSRLIGRNFVLKIVADDKFQCRWNLEQFSVRCVKKTEICYTFINTHILKNTNKVKLKTISHFLSKSKCLSNLDKFDCEYAWAVIQSKSDTILHHISVKNKEIPDYAARLQKELLKLAESNVSAFVKSLYFIADMLDKGVIFDFLLFLEKKFSYFCNYVQQNELPPGMIYVRRILITPSRIIFLQPHEHFENRITRKFGVEYMIRASIQDDDYSKLTYAVQYNSKKEKIMQDVVGSVLLNGIFVGSRKYEFLAASTSQLREHGVWMYAKDDRSNTASSVRQWMGDFSGIKNVAKYMARMGQCLSSTETGVQVHIESKNEICIDDIKTGGYIFSDGIGIISSDLAEEVHLTLLKNSTNCSPQNAIYKPVAFQIRYKGCKGMVVEYPIPGRKLFIRPSMKKFECTTSNQLEIVKTSGPTKLFLNKHLITILEQMGVSREVFMHLEVTMILNLLDSLVEETVAASHLTHCLSSIFPFSDLCRAGFSLTSEPFFRSLLLAYFKSFAEKLRTNMRISIPSEYGRNMLGVLDETDMLKYGEVFVQYSKSLTDPNAGYEILEGPVIVTKNPSLHPGDVRKLTAVDVPKLHHIKDCIVFPAKGKRPHPDEMAGSDLDGDEMVVLWYEPLIFKRKNATPMNYPVYEEMCANRDIQLSDMVSFFCQYIQHDNIGTFAHAHLVWADILQNGIFSKKCMNIAKRYPYVLDFAKHGTTEFLNKSERPKEYPDFLQKGLRGNTYHSQRALGSLYRTSRVLDACSSKINLVCETSSYDPDLEYPGWQAYQESANLQRSAYIAKVLEILDRYCLNTEAEAFSGMIQLHVLKNWRQERSNTMKVINKYLCSIMNRYRAIFLKEFEEECQKDGVEKQQRLERKYRRASAWYMVMYGQKSGRVLSFPWVVGDILADIKAKTKLENCSIFQENRFLQDIDSDIKQWSSTEVLSHDEKKCLCNFLLEKISLKWIYQSGLNIGKRKEDAYCDSCYQRIFEYYKSESDLQCCSSFNIEHCTCKIHCSPAKILMHFFKFFLMAILKPALGHCNIEQCDGFLSKNLQELCLQTYCYIVVTRNIFYLGIPFNTKSFTKNAISHNMFEEEVGEPIKIPVNPILKDMVENHTEEIVSHLQKSSGVRDITLTPEQHSMCLIVSSVGKNWQRWNLQEILLDTNFTTNLKKNLGV